MAKIALSTSAAPAALGPYSQAIKAGNMVFCSGQLGIDPATGKLADGVEAQAEQALKNIEHVLAETGATLDDVVKTTVLLADIADFSAVNEVYGSKFSEPYPARSAFQAAAIPAGGLVEIEVIAVLP